jgi:hypothetical protein
MNVNIVPGVTIGEGAIISMGTTVSKDVPAYAIVGSNEQRVLGTRNVPHYDELSTRRAIGGPSGGAYFPPEEVNVEYVFVVSTGRAGSMSIVDTFQPHPDISGVHEPMYAFLKYFSTEYLMGRIGNGEAKRILLSIWNSTITPRTKFFLVSDQKLVPLITITREIFPQAKWVWLIREPEAFVHSAASREWFKDDDPIIRNDGGLVVQPRYLSDGVRVTGPLVGTAGIEEWAESSQVERLVWYWSYWNGLIADQLSVVPEGRRMFVRLEEFNHRYREVREFIGVADPDGFIKPKKSNTIRRKHVEKFQKEKLLRSEEFAALPAAANSLKLLEHWTKTFGTN